MAEPTLEQSRGALAGLLEQIASPSEIWRRETYELGLVARLLPDDRATFGAALRHQIATGDPYAALTAGQAGFHDLLDSLWPHRREGGWFGLSVRRALVSLGEGRRVIPELVDDLRAPGKMHRFAAAVALESLGSPPDPAVVAALVAALDDPDMLVVKTAYEALLSILSLVPFARIPGSTEAELRSPLERYALLSRSDLVTLRGPARAALQEIFQHALAGDSAETLGLVYTPGADREIFLRLGQSLYNPTVPVPLVDLMALRGEDKAYAETLLVVSLERCWLSSLRALVALGARWTAPAIRESMSLDMADDAFQEAATEALRSLESPPPG